MPSSQYLQTSLNPPLARRADGKRITLARIHEHAIFRRCMRIAKRLLLLIVAALSVGQVGCVLLAAGAVGGGATAFGISRGTVTRTFDASVESTVTATQSALQDLGLPVQRPRIGPAYSEIDSTLAGGEPLLLTLKAEIPPVPNDPPKTRVDVHAKVFGDKAISERLLDQISHRLKNPAPPPAVQTTLPPPPKPDQTDEPGLAPAKFTRP